MRAGYGGLVNNGVVAGLLSGSKITIKISTLAADGFVRIHRSTYSAVRETHMTRRNQVF